MRFLRKRPPTTEDGCTVSLDTATALARAEALATTGSYTEAIALLTHGTPRHPRTERRLVDLRYDAFVHGAWPTEPAPFPETPDLFPWNKGIPEIEHSELDVERLRSAILHHGSLIVRGLFSPDRAERLRNGIDRTFAAYDAIDHGTNREHGASWFVPFARYSELGARRWVRGGGGVLAVDSPAAMYDMIESFESIGLRSVVDGFFGEQGVLLGKKWTLRRVDHSLEHISKDWHQDGAFMGRDIRSLNLWVALSHCGDDAPGLDLVAQRFEEIVETGTGGASLNWTVGPDTVEEVAPGRAVRPIFDAGDAVFFDHMNLHRTAVDPGMRNDRYAIESWFLAPSTYGAMTAEGDPDDPTRPNDQMPLVF